MVPIPGLADVAGVLAWASPNDENNIEGSSPPDTHRESIFLDRAPAACIAATAHLYHFTPNQKKGWLCSEYGTCPSQQRCTLEYYL